MRTYKTYKSELEDKRFIFFEIGLIISLATILYSLEFKSYLKSDIDKKSLVIDDTPEEMVEITLQNKEPPPPSPPEQTTIIEIVDNDIEVEQEIKIDVEANQDTEMEEYNPIIESELEEDEEEAEEQVFMVVESMPQFPGGENGLMKYLSENISYPKAARESGIQGRVFVSFVVEKDGKVTNIIILRGIGGGCDEEAIKVVQKMPKWIPGKQRGMPVRVQFNLPINFTLR